MQEPTLYKFTTSLPVICADSHLISSATDAVPDAGTFIGNEV